MPINLKPDEKDYDGSNDNTTDDLLSLLLLDERDDEFEVALKAATVASCRPSSNESSPCLYEGNNYASSKTNNMMTVGGDYGIDSTPMFGMLPQELQNQFSSTSQEVENNQYHNYHYQFQMPQTSRCAESRTGVEFHSGKFGDSTPNNYQQENFVTYNNNNTLNNINNSYYDSNSTPSTISSSLQRQREVSFSNNEKNKVGVLNVEENITTNIQQQAQQQQHQKRQPLTNEQQNALIFLQPLTSEERHDITGIMDAMKERFSGPS